MFSLFLEEENFNSQKMPTLIGGKIPQGQLLFRGLSTEQTFIQLFHTRQKTNKRPSISLCKMTSTNYSTSVFPACSLAKCYSSLSEVSETKQTLLKSAYSIARGQPVSRRMNSALSTRVGFQMFWPRIVPRAEPRHTVQLTQRKVHTFSMGWFKIPTEIGQGVAESILKTGRNLLKRNSPWSPAR